MTEVGLARAARGRGARVIALCAIAAIGCGGMADALAAEKSAAAPRRVTIVVFGDSLADGLWAAIYRRFARNRNVHVVRATKVSSGFTAYNYQAQLKELIDRHKIDALVVQVGANDRQRMMERGRGLIRLGSEEWAQVYRERLEQFIVLANEAKIATYWVGLPIMRDPAATKDALMMNQLYEEAARKRGATYISTWDVTSNKDGVYDAFFADDDGRRRRFRADDGVHFSFLGYDWVAGHVLSVIRRKQPNLLPELGE